MNVISTVLATLKHSQHRSHYRFTDTTIVKPTAPQTVGIFRLPRILLCCLLLPPLSPRRYLHPSPKNRYDFLDVTAPL